MSDFDEATLQAVREIEACHNEILNIDTKASEEIRIIEQKYNELGKPLFDKRSEIISNIPNFWITAIMNHPDLSALLDNTEENCLYYLTKLEVEKFEDLQAGYWIKFYFEENPYFENAVLTKECHLDCDTPAWETTQIIWKEGCTLGQTFEISRSEGNPYPDPSKVGLFLSWFNDNSIDPLTDKIADVIMDDLWLNPVKYYLTSDNGVDGGNGIEQEDRSSSSENEGYGDNEENESADSR